eukprot:g1357.t1
MTSKPEDRNVILCMVDSMIYPITEENIRTVVSAYGEVVKTVIYEQSGIWQALVQYVDSNSAKVAKQALEGHAIYEGGYNKLRIFQSSKEALAYASAVVASPDYQQLNEQQQQQQSDNTSTRVIVDGDDYVRAHSEIGRGALACLSGLPLPPSFIPTTLPPPGAPVSTPSVPPMVGPVYVAPGAYVHPGARGQIHPGAISGPYQVPMNILSVQDTRYPPPIPMTTYQHPHVMPRSMRSNYSGSSNNNNNNTKLQGAGDERMK